MWEFNHKESWAPKNRYFWTIMLEKTLENLLDCKETQPVHPKGNQSWSTDAEAEIPIIWPPDTKNWLTGKDPDAGKDWRQEEKGTTEDEIVERHHQLNGHVLVWVSSGSWWWTGMPSMLQSTESQRVGHDWSDLAVAAKSLQMVIAAMKLKDTPWKKSYDQPREHI